MPEKGESRSLENSSENFIKAVYNLQQTTDRVSTNALRDALGITAPSVTDMAKRLAQSGVLDYQKYHGVRLTDKGLSLALRIVRRHRLIELYLVSELAYELHEVHAEAEVLEHAVSDRFIEAIAHKLGHPAFDPHGDPIPSSDGKVLVLDLQPLTEVPLETPVRVSRYNTSDAEMLQHTIDRGFSLNIEVQVLARDPFEGPLTVQIGNQATIIGHLIAELILVEVLEKC